MQWPATTPGVNGRKFHFVAAAQHLPGRDAQPVEDDRRLVHRLPLTLRTPPTSAAGKTNALRCQGHRESRDISRTTGHLGPVFESRAGNPRLNCNSAVLTNPDQSSIEFAKLISLALVAEPPADASTGSTRSPKIRSAKPTMRLATRPGPLPPLPFLARARP